MQIEQFLNLSGATPLGGVTKIDIKKENIYQKRMRNTILYYYTVL